MVSCFSQFKTSIPSGLLPTSPAGPRRMTNYRSSFSSSPQRFVAPSWIVPEENEGGSKRHSGCPSVGEKHAQDHTTWKCNATDAGKPKEGRARPHGLPPFPHTRPMSRHS